MGCGNRTVNFVLGDQTYSFPRNVVNSYLLPPDGPAYVMLKPSDDIFIAIHSARRDMAAARYGSRELLIYGINDIAPGTLVVQNFASGPTICDTTKRARHCGFLVDHNGVKWSILFSQDHLRESEAIRVRAKQLLDGFRV